MSDERQKDDGNGEDKCWICGETDLEDGGFFSDVRIWLCKACKARNFQTEGGGEVTKEADGKGKGLSKEDIIAISKDMFPDPMEGHTDNGKGEANGVDLDGNPLKMTITTGDLPKQPVGWICPKCDRAIAPWMDHCPFCAASVTYKHVYTGTATGDPIPPQETTTWM